MVLWPLEAIVEKVHSAFEKWMGSPGVGYLLERVCILFRPSCKLFPGFGHNVSSVPFLEIRFVWQQEVKMMVQTALLNVMCGPYTDATHLIIILPHGFLEASAFSLPIGSLATFWINWRSAMRDNDMGMLFNEEQMSSVDNLGFFEMLSWNTNRDNYLSHRYCV